MTLASQKIAIITGANAGVGFGIAQRLLETQKQNVTIIMACRNQAKANAARQQLIHQFTNSHVHIELVDMNSISSVLAFCASIKQLYKHIDYLFCNAGILSAHGIRWSELIWIFLKDPVGLAENSDATHQIMGEINEDGLGKVFASNVFGHYVMARELEGLLSQSGDGRVIWTSSITANASVFNLQDWQGIESEIPYESSKWACDLIAVMSNEHYRKNGLAITSYTTSPGVVASSIGSLPSWVTFLRTLLHYLMRFLGVTSQNITGYRGALADVYVALQPHEILDHMSRYMSLTSRWGKSYVGKDTIDDYDPEQAQSLISKCEVVYQAWKKKSL